MRGEEGEGEKIRNRQSASGGGKKKKRKISPGNEKKVKKGECGKLKGQKDFPQTPNTEK